MAQDFNHLPEVIEKLKATGRQIVKKGAFDVQGASQRRAPVKTGFLRSAIYTETADGSTYGHGITGDGTLEPELNGDTEDGQVAWVVAGADYSIYPELGTSDQPAQPYMVPGAEEVRPSYEAAWAKLDEALRV